MLDSEPGNPPTQQSDPDNASTETSAKTPPTTGRRRSASRPAGPPVDAIPTTESGAQPSDEAGTQAASTVPAKKAAKRTPAKRTPRKTAKKAAAAPVSQPVETEVATPVGAADGAPTPEVVVEVPPQTGSESDASGSSTSRQPDPTFDAPAEPTTKPARKRAVRKTAAPKAASVADAESTIQLELEAANQPFGPSMTQPFATTAGAEAATSIDQPSAPPARNPFEVPDIEVRPANVQAEPTGTADEPQRATAKDDTGTDEDAPTGPEEDAENDDDSDTDSDQADSDDDDDGDSDGNRRRRRRRGGRRRRRSSGSDADSAEDGKQDDQGKADQLAAGQADGSDEPSAQNQSGSDADDSNDSDGDDQNGESEGQRRRRRRRRRRGEDAGNSPDDPSDVVVRVREPRSRGRGSSSDEKVTGIEGSTRMEAKRQRRREGREAGRRRAPILSEAEFLARRESVARKMVIRQLDDTSSGAGDSLAQIAVLEDDILVEHYVDRESATSLIGNVYLGRVQNVLPSMEAAFIDIGRGRNAVLYAGEVDWESFGAQGGERKVERVLKSGQNILVQVSKDPVGAKGARLTNHVSIPGRYLVYAPGGHLSGISRKLPENERKRLKDILAGPVGDTASVIVRTAAEGASEEELVRDINRLKAQWESIEAKIKGGSAPQQLYAEPDLTIRIVRDLFTEDFAELIIQGNGSMTDAYDSVEAYASHVAPHLADRIRRWDADEQGDLFGHYRLDEQIAKGLERKVFLPSGGSLIIDRTEAMTVIDVNTGKFTGSGGNLEATITSNNLEAAEEIVRQLRLRDIGGIIVVDFIDMVLPSNRELLLRRLVECLGRDRTRHQVAEVTSLGLVQMTRKKIGTGLLEAFSSECPHCHGRGVELHDMPVASQKQADGGARHSGDHGGKSSDGQGNGRRGNRNDKKAEAEADQPEKAEKSEKKEKGEKTTNRRSGRNGGGRRTTDHSDAGAEQSPPESQQLTPEAKPVDDSVERAVEQVLRSASATATPQPAEFARAGESDKSGEFAKSGAAGQSGEAAASGGRNRRGRGRAGRPAGPPSGAAQADSSSEASSAPQPEPASTPAT